MSIWRHNIKQLTLRQIPSIVEKKLRKLAQERGQSINKTVLYLLKKALGLEKEGRKFRDLGELSCNWSIEEAESFMKNTGIFEQIDKGMWK